MASFFFSCEVTCFVFFLIFFFFLRFRFAFFFFFFSFIPCFVINFPFSKVNKDVVFSVSNTFQSKSVEEKGPKNNSFLLQKERERKKERKREKERERERKREKERECEKRKKA